MAGNRADCCKFIFACLNFAFAVVGFYFYGFGGWLKKRADSIEEGNLLSLIFKICMAQGTAMEAMATCGIYYYRTTKGCSLKVFSAFLAALALADIVIGVFLYFKCEEVRKALMEFYFTNYNRFKDGDAEYIIPFGVIHMLFSCCGDTNDPEPDRLRNPCRHPDLARLPRCPERITAFFDMFSPLVLAIFLGTAALVTVALVCTIFVEIKTRQGNEHYTARFSSPS